MALWRDSEAETIVEVWVAADVVSNVCELRKSSNSYQVID
jgi:hypothetical protein